MGGIQANGLTGIPEHVANIVLGREGSCES